MRERIMMEDEGKLQHLKKQIEFFRKELISIPLNTKESLEKSHKLDELVVEYLKLKEKQK